MSQIDKVAVFVLTSFVALIIAGSLIVSLVTGDWSTFGSAVVALLLAGLIGAAVWVLFAIGERLFPDR